jgi:hypothetical protein
MVIAGTRNRKIHGARINRESSVAYPFSRIFMGVRKSQMKELLARRKTTMTTYPVRLLKKPVISFLKSVHIPEGSKLEFSLRQA